MSSFFDELKRRNVVRVGVAYGVAAWVLLQVSDLILENIKAPDWVIQAMMLVVLIGFIAALVIAWAYELTPEGIKREADVDRNQSVTGETSHKLDRIIIGFLVLAVVYFIYDKQTATPAVVAPEPIQAIQKEAAPEIVSEPSIAVLPFADMSPEKDQEYFSDGISEELLNLLVRVDGLKVASRTSSFAFKGSQQSLADIASDLKVDHVLEGSIRKSDNRVRITAQLIDAATDRHLWSDTYDRELNDIFGIQDEIANAIVSALRTELGMLEDAPQITVKVDTENLDAYELYLKGRALFLERNQLDESIRLLETAVDLDPDFARAWESLAAVYSVVEDWGITDRDYDALSIVAADRALELNPELSTPWAVKGQNNFVPWSKALEYMDKAIASDPKNATAYLWRSIAWSTLGFVERAFNDAESCLDIDPYYENCRRHLAMYALVLGDEKQAMELYQISLERGFWGSENTFLHLLIRNGQRMTAALGMWNYMSDRTFPASSILDAVEFPERDHSKTIGRFVSWVEQQNLSVNEFSGLFTAMKEYQFISADDYWNHWQWLPLHAEFRRSDQFKQLYREMDIVDYWRENGFPPQCRPLGDEDFECD